MTVGTAGTALRSAAPARAEVLLRRVELRLARRLPGRLAGTHAGLGVGPGWQAESARPYQPGVDDVRFMDWPVTARLGEPHVREHEAERELETTVVVDTSPSMAFGTVEWPKRELAAAVVAAVGVLTDRPGDRLGALVHTAGSGDRRFVRWPPRSGRRARLLLLRSLLEAPPASVPDGDRPATLADACRAAAAQLRRPGLVVVVSDFLDADVAGLEAALRPLTVRHDVLAVQVRDPLESELVDVGVLGVVDPETGAGAVMDTGDAAFRAAYREVVAEHDAAVAAVLRAARVGSVRVTTGGDWIGALARYVLTARRVGARGGAR